MTAAAITAIIVVTRDTIGILVIAIATVIVTATATGIGTVQATTGRTALARRDPNVRHPEPLS